MTYTELLLGCGSRRAKDLSVQGRQDWHDLTTLDINPDHKPDVLWNLNLYPLPFGDNSFDEIHAYQVLEHLGRQGDYKFFFDEFTDYWRILKPGGLFFASVPLYTSKWAWGDPSHTRVIQEETLIYLDQHEYANQVGRTSISDFRYMYKAHFDRMYVEHDNENLFFILQAVKPT